jgi:hypothetical protein
MKHANRTLLIAGAAALSFSAVPAASAQTPPGRTTVRVACPTQQVTVGVETPASFPAPWWDTPFVMQLLSLSTSIPVGGKPGLSCIYKGSGRDWIVSRPVAPEFKSCVVNGYFFVCTK